MNVKMQGDGGEASSEADSEIEQVAQPLTRAEVQALRDAGKLGAANLSGALPAKTLFAGQFAIAALMAVIAAVGWGKAAMWSSLYGWFAAWLPMVVMAWRLGLLGASAQDAGQHAVNYAGVGLVRFFVWEGVKLVMTIALLLLAPKMVPALNWLALLIGLVVGLKTVWLVWWLAKKI